MYTESTEDALLWNNESVMSAVPSPFGPHHIPAFSRMRNVTSLSGNPGEHVGRSVLSGMSWGGVPVPFGRRNIPASLQKALVARKHNHDFSDVNGECRRYITVEQRNLNVMLSAVLTCSGVPVGQYKNSTKTLWKNPFVLFPSRSVAATSLHPCGRHQ